jgi:parallel beta-helix repeat protein
MLTSLFRKLRSAPTSARTKPSKAPRLQVELLEDRWVPSTLMVDDNLMQCPNAGYTSINAAVAAAHAGDTIHVCEGIYHESVTVNKSLTLEGDNRLAVVEPPAGSAGFSLQANKITVRNFTIEGASGNACIYTSPLFSGYRIQNNLIQNNSMGLYLNSKGDTQSLVRGNDFVANNAAGAGSGNGIYADQGTRNVTIAGNTFRDHLNAGILFANAGTEQRNIAILGNVSTNDTTFVALFHTTNVVVDGNRVFDTNSADNADQGSKIFVGGDSHNIAITRNRIDGGGYDGIAVRDTLGADGSTTRVYVSGNVISDVDRDGISITATAAGAAQVIGNDIFDVGNDGILLSAGTRGIFVAQNYVTGSGQDGISLVSSTNNTLRANRSTDNGRDGIRLDSGSTGNFVTKNRLQDNAEHDAHDDSVGTGTAGTANTWDKNSCETDNRPGLCKSKGRDKDKD